MKEEFWKPVVGYEGLYEVSSLGRVRSLNRGVFQQGRVQKYKGCIMSQFIGSHGYYSVRLSNHNKKKTFLVHRIAAEAFIPNTNNLPVVNHKDEDRKNNSIDNLEWCTIAYNVNYGTTPLRRSIILGNKVAQYTTNGVLMRTFHSIHDAERKTGIKRQSIHKAIYLKRQAGGCFWTLTSKEAPLRIDTSIFSRRVKNVLQLDGNETVVARFKSTRKAELSTGIRHEYISRCCRGVISVAGKYKWRYA